MTRKKIYVLLLTLILISSAFYGYGVYSNFYPSTDDAYVQANIVNIAPQISGLINNIDTADHQFVKSGQRLFSIDPEPFEIALEKAKANLAQTQAQTDTQKKETVRILKLVSQGQASASEGDAAKGKLDSLTAALKAAKNTLLQAELELRYTKIIAPANGYISNFTLRKGQMVQTGSFQFALVENSQWWIDANFKETDLKRIKIHQPAKIILDMYPSLTFHGKVAGISAGSGASFAILPPENATGNWVKVTQRFAVRINITDADHYPDYPLRVGASGKVKINTR